MKDPNNVYIGRKGIVFVPREDGGKERWPKQDSPFCNPFKVGRDGTREETRIKFKNHIETKIKEDPTFLNELKGKNLGCWCKPKSCHGDQLLKLLQPKKKIKAKFKAKNNNLNHGT